MHYHKNTCMKTNLHVHKLHTNAHVHVQGTLNVKSTFICNNDWHNLLAIQMGFTVTLDSANWHYSMFGRGTHIHTPDT